MSAEVTSLAIGRASFPLADCAACGGPQLVYVDVLDDGADVRRCIGCDRIVDDPEIALAKRRDVEAAGYAFIDRRAKAPPKLSGCGAKGVRGCGSGGCSSGSCGSGGCSSGSCGSH